jgi:hypothetical protein
MVRTWQAFLKLVWPHEVIPKANTTHQVVRFFNGTQYLSLYRDPTIQTLIKQTKYQANQTAAIQLASYLNWYVDSVKTDYVIIPMPEKWTYQPATGNLQLSSSQMSDSPPHSNIAWWCCHYRSNHGRRPSSDGAPLTSTHKTYLPGLGSLKNHQPCCLLACILVTCC